MDVQPALERQASGTAPFLGLLIALVIAMVIVPIAWRWPMLVIARVSGLAMLGALWAIYTLATGAFGLGRLVMGTDGRLSTSKFQWLLWTAATIYAYTVFIFAKTYQGHFEPLTSVPQGLMYAMGFSATTMAAAKGITSTYAHSGQLTKVLAQHPAAWGQLFRDDLDVPDLSKTQLMAWTLIAVAVYIVRVLGANLICSGSACPELPEIDPVLLALLGLAQAGYIGKKIATT